MLICADGVNILSKNIISLKEMTNEDIDLEVNTELNLGIYLCLFAKCRTI